MFQTKEQDKTSEKELNEMELSQKLEGITGRLDDAEERISNMEDRLIGNHPIKTAKQKKNFKK